MKKLLGMTGIMWAFLPLLAIADGQQLTITNGPATVAINQPFTVQISATAPSQGWAALGWTLTYNGASPVVVTQPVVSAVGGKFVESQNGTNTTKTILAGADCGTLALPPTAPCGSLNATPVTAAGPVATISLTAPGAVQNITLTLTSPSMADATGTGIATTVGPSVTIPVTAPNFCDLDGNGVVDGFDVSIEEAWILLGAPTGKTAQRTAGSVPGGGAQDVELIVNASLGQTCKATQ